MKAKPVYALLFFIAVVLCYRLFGYSGHFGFDDMQYAEIAANILNGNVDYDDHFTFRFTLIGATVLSYKLFGINDFASSLPAMAVTLLMLTIVYAALRKRDFWTTAAGLALTTTSQWILFYSNKLMPDIYLALFTVLAAYTYYHHKYGTHKHTVLHAVTFASALFMGFMSKGTVVLLLPWLLFLFLSDRLQRKEFGFWKWALLAGAGCLVLYFACIKVMTGEFLYRFKAIAQNSYLNTCSYDQQPLRILLRRLYFDFFDMTVNNGMAVPMVFVVAAFATRKWREILKMPDEASYFAVSALLLFLSSNFMTISATSYVPMCIDPRHYLFLMPVAAIAAAHFLTRQQTRKQTVTVIGLFLLLSLYTFFGNPSICYWVYLPVTLVTIAAILLKNRQIPYPYLGTAMLLALLALPLKMMSDRSYQYNERRDALVDHLVKNDRETPVVSDNACTRMMRYHDGFSANDRYVDFEHLDEEAAEKAQGDVKLVLNYHTLALQGLSYDDLPDYAFRAFSSQKPDFDNYGIKIYTLDRTSLAKPDYDTLFSSVNHFDSDCPDFWRSGYELTDKTSHSGSLSNKVGTYSATFSYPLDSLRHSHCDMINIMVSAQCNCFANTGCVIVVSIDKDDSTLSWNSMGITHGMKAYSHWFPMGYQHEIALKDIPEGAVANVYFLKNDKAEVYIDDFRVSLCQKTLR